jgi:predicted AAA+ superfamily ATPase
MKDINRIVEREILKYLQPNKVIVIMGARRTGKTYLINQITRKLTDPCLILNAEDFSVREILKRRSAQHYRNLLGDKKILIIDEAHQIPEIGQILKLMVDEIKGLKIIITGSSAFDISGLTGGPLTGRKYTFQLFPFSEIELSQVEDYLLKHDKMRQRLVFGNYPELIHIESHEGKSKYLIELVDSYLIKDILTFENIRNANKILQLLRLISYQVGSEVSFQELGNSLSLSKNTVERYLDLLTKVFVLYRLEGFSRNLRKEITKSTKWYFLDNGIRNTIIGNLNPLETRNDTGFLWENYVISERIKYQKNNGILVNNYFWRTYDQQELDWVEERGGKLFGYEMKWHPGKIKVPVSWKKAYPGAGFEIITPQSYLQWLS